MVVVKALTRCDLVIDRVEPYGDRNHHRGDRQGVEERREEGRGNGEHEGQEHLRTNAKEDLRKEEKKQFAHEVDARHHEHQQQDDREIGEDLRPDAFRIGHADEHGF